jgi:MoaA/NifB/PqqE/SkfB family radical SAM enzyme
MANSINLKKAKEKSSELNLPENICILPWVHAAIDFDGKVIPCCRWDPAYDKGFEKVQDVGFKTAWRNDAFNNIRERMLNNEKLSGCWKCWQDEDSSKDVALNSMRLFANRKYYNSSIEEPVLKYLELGFGTHCNLACRMCSDEYSSKWAVIKNPEKKFTDGFDFNSDNIDIDLSNLEEIKFVGGEPMMARDHDKFLQRILDTHPNLKKLKLRYHTNGTVLPSDNVIKFWEKVGKVYLSLSIDGVGKINETQRPGHTWNTIEKNYEFYKSLNNVTIDIHTVVTILNVFHLRELNDWVLSKDINNWVMMPAYNPKYLSIKNMNEETKTKALSYIESVPLTKEYIKDRLKHFLMMEADKQYTEEDLRQRFSLIDEYFNQDAYSIL